MNKISVIIPVYNVERYLKQCLDSICNQTLKDIEIICINDGSTDGSLKILESYAKKDKRFIILDQANQGAGIARNNGLKIANGEYVIFFDGDDYMESNALESLYKDAIKYQADITIAKSYKLIEATQEINVMNYAVQNNLIQNKIIFSPQEVAKYIFQFCIGWPWDKLYSRKFILDNHLEFQNLRHSNDTYFVLFSLVLANKICIINQNLFIHRLHSLSLEHTRIKQPDCFYYALKKLYNELNDKNIYHIYQQSFINYCVTFSMWHINTINDNKAQQMLKKIFKTMVKAYKINSFSENYFYDKSYFKYFKTKYILREKIKKIFLIKNSEDNRHKVITILGIKIKLKKK